MRVLIEGSGGVAGWPQPGCRCASCLRAELDGNIRARSTIIIDGAVRLGVGGAEDIGGGDTGSGAGNEGAGKGGAGAASEGRGGAMGRTATRSPWSSWPTTRPPAGPKPARASVSALSGSATNVSPTVASATRVPSPPTGATGCASTGSAGSPGPNSSSTVRPSARDSASATRSEGSEWPDSTADTACLVTAPMPASCCWDRPRACRASRSRVPAAQEGSVTLHTL